ncbi:MAG: 4Fe-4S dicluster domain-containing protein [Clostridia bacterium]
MSKIWYPVINTEKCIECGACIKKCKYGVYKNGTKTPIVIYPEGCIQGCKGCGNICPVGAIEYIGDKGQILSDCGCGKTKELEKEDNTKDCGCGESCGCDCTK